MAEQEEQERAERLGDFRYLIAGIVTLLSGPLVLSIMLDHEVRGSTYLLILFYGSPVWLPAVVVGGIGIRILERLNRQYLIISAAFGAIFGAVGKAAFNGLTGDKFFDTQAWVDSTKHAAPFLIAGAISALIFHAIAINILAPRKETTAP
jgi:hypothetical protein